MAKKVTTTGYRTVLNKEHSPYRNDIYKRPRHDKFKHNLNEKTNSLLYYGEPWDSG